MKNNFNDTIAIENLFQIYKMVFFTKHKNTLSGKKKSVKNLVG